MVVETFAGSLRAVLPRIRERRSEIEEGRRLPPLPASGSRRPGQLLPGLSLRSHSGSVSVSVLGPAVPGSLQVNRPCTGLPLISPLSLQ